MKYIYILLFSGLYLTTIHIQAMEHSEATSSSDKTQQTTQTPIADSHEKKLKINGEWVTVKDGIIIEKDGDVCIEGYGATMPTHLTVRGNGMSHHISNIQPSPSASISITSDRNGNIMAGGNSPGLVVVSMSGKEDIDPKLRSFLDALQKPNR